MVAQERIIHTTQGRSSIELTAEVERIVARSGIRRGLCHVFVHHTSASLMLCENADPTVRRDLEVFMARLVPDGDPLFRHTTEGPDDMPAHIRSVLTGIGAHRPGKRRPLCARDLAGDLPMGASVSWLQARADGDGVR